jgi:hypothetical protein
MAAGTLSPLASFAAELGVSFDVCVVADHVIDVKKTAVHWVHGDLPQWQPPT